MYASALTEPQSCDSFNYRTLKKQNAEKKRVHVSAKAAAGGSGAGYYREIPDAERDMPGYVEDGFGAVHRTGCERRKLKCAFRLVRLQQEPPVTAAECRMHSMRFVS